MNVVWTPRARADLRSIRDYLSSRSPRASRRVFERIIKRVDAQKKMPLAAPLERDGPERCLVISKTPYLVLYTASDTEITVVAVYHTAQNR